MAETTSKSIYNWRRLYASLKCYEINENLRF